MTRVADLDRLFGIRCAAVRAIRGLSQSAIARQSSIHQSAISKIESGDRSVSIAEAVKISAALSMPLAEMIGDGEVHIVSVG